LKLQELNATRLDPVRLRRLRRWLRIETPRSRAHLRPWPTCDYCSVTGCGHPVIARGLCGGHYRRRRLSGSVQEDKPIRVYDPGKISAVAACPRPVAAHGVCTTHYARLKRWGDPEARYVPKGHVTRTGYRMTFASDHPMALRNGHVMEHRLVMANASERCSPVHQDPG
jgi:hypothetical protein